MTDNGTTPYVSGANLRIVYRVFIREDLGHVLRDYEYLSLSLPVPTEVVTDDDDPVEHKVRVEFSNKHPTRRGY